VLFRLQHRSQLQRAGLGLYVRAVYNILNSRVEKPSPDGASESYPFEPKERAERHRSALANVFYTNLQSYTDRVLCSQVGAIHPLYL
jgi:hypothetical protein